MHHLAVQQHFSGFDDITQWSFEEVECPQQTGADCAVFTILHLTYEATNRDIDFEGHHAEFFRRYFTYQLLKHLI